MSLGERGGTTSSLTEASDLIATHKDDWAAAVRTDILEHLESRPEWHRDDLRVQLPAESKNVLGAVVNGLVRSGRIVETGERRASSEPAAHGRRSAVYRLSTVSGSRAPESVGPSPVNDETTGPASPAASPPAKEVVQDPAELTGGRTGAGEDANRVTSHSGSTSPAPTLFELPADRPGFVDIDQREAA